MGIRAIGSAIRRGLWVMCVGVSAWLAGAAPGGVPSGGTGRAFTVAVFPDTQNFSMNHPEVYLAMCRWIADNRERWNIVFASHVGDIVNDDTDRQWANARAAHDVLARAGLPMGLAIGNHDGGDTFRLHMVGERYLANFGPGAPYDASDPSKGTFAEQPWYGGSSASGLSSYQLLPPESTGGVPMLFLHLEVGLRSEEVAWAADVVRTHGERVVVLATHRYLYDYRIMRGRFGPYVHEQFDPRYLGQSVDGDGLFEGLIGASPNIAMVWCGHVDGEYRQVSTNVAGLPVHEHLQDFQSFSPRGGNGWFRLYTFDPAAGEIRVNTVSPVAGPGDTARFRTQADQLRELSLALVGYRDEGSRRAGMGMSGLDPRLKEMLVAAFERPGAASRLIASLRTGRGEFAAIFPLIDAVSPERAAVIRRQIAEFPWETLSPGLVRVLDREGAPIVRAYLDGDQDALMALLAADGHALMIEAFLSDGDRTPSFTVPFDFDAYLSASSR